MWVALKVLVQQALQSTWLVFGPRRHETPSCLPKWSSMHPTPPLVCINSFPFNKILVQDFVKLEGARFVAHATK